MEKVKLLILIVQCILELLKWLSKEHNTALPKTVDNFKAALKKANEGETDDLEKMFTIKRNF